MTGAAGSNPREIRIFISSTFRDMHAERELLVKRVFPELRRLCADRFVTFTEVDLRWGITEEQQAEGQVLPICLEEIERSRPYFLGLLGERYGWITEGISSEVLEREPWLQEHVGARRSVTELEILHGVLRRPSMHGHAYFYFRDPAYLEHLPPGSVRADFESESAPAAEKVRRLKDHIRQARDQGICRLLEDYPDPEALADAVRAHLTDLIDRLYPRDEVPDPLDEEARGHAAYAQGKRFAFVERPAHAAALDAAVAGAGPRLVVTGPSGGGKTALLAAWAAHWRDAHPDDFVFEHYFGATPQSAAATGFLQRLLGELKRRYDIDEEIPVQPDELRDALPLWLARTVRRGRIVLVLDGLNQIEGDEPDRRLGFLPRHFPPHVRVVASCLAGPALDALHQRGWAEHALPLPDSEERDAMITAFLETYRKTLRPDLRQKLVDAPGATNPLFLRTLLEELRQFGSFERLPARLAHYLEADTPEELFRRVLRRWREDFDAGLDLVRRSLRLLWVARQGLAEAEWLELLGEPGQPLARQRWRPLFLAMEPHLAQRAGLYAFGHDFLRGAVELEYLDTVEMQHAAHQALADYFEQLPGLGPRKAAEWPWQLAEAGEWGRMEAALTTKGLFLALFNDRTKWELTGYWLRLKEAQPGTSMGAAYEEAYPAWVGENIDWEVASLIAHQLGMFLEQNGAYEEARPLIHDALESYERVLGPEHPKTLTSVNNLAFLLESTGDYAQAEPLYRRALAGHERVLGPEHPDTLTSVNNLAGLLESTGDYARAMQLYQRALAARERTLGPEHPDTLTSVNNVAFLLKDMGDYAQAEPLYRHALARHEQVMGPEHPNTLTSVKNLAGILSSTGNYAQATPLYWRALTGRERVLGPEHPDTLTSVNDLAFLLSSTGDQPQAERLYQRALEGYERVLGPEHPKTLTSVNNLAGLLESTGDYARARQLYQRALGARERMLGPEHPDTLTSVNNLAALLVRTGDYTQAEPLFQRVLAARERVLGPEHPDTLASVNNLAFLLDSTGDYAQAKPLYRRALAGHERVLGLEHPNTLTSVNNLAGCLMSTGGYAQAEPLFRRALASSERVLGPEHPDTLGSLNNLAVLLYRTGDYAQAEPLHRRALAGRERVLGPDHPETLSSAANLAVLLESVGDYAQAEPLFRRAVAGFSQVLGPDHPRTATCRANLEALLRDHGGSLADYLEIAGQNEQALAHWQAFVQAELDRVGPDHPDVALALNRQAIVLRRLGRPAEAEPLLRRAIEIERNALAPDSPKHPHRLNNLCSVLLMQGKLAEATSLSAQAWRLEAGQHDITSARILFFRLAIALLDGEPVSIYIGQEKRLLTGGLLGASGNVTTTWDVASILESLSPKLAASDIQLLETLAAALNDPEKVADLDRFPAWRDQAPVPLDVEWPESS